MIIIEPKMLPSSLRQNKRYVVFEVVSEQPVAYQDLVNAVWYSTLSFLGEALASEARPLFIVNLYENEKQRGVIKCAHNTVEQMRAVLSLISVIGESRSIVHVLGITGTIKSAKAKYFDQN